MRAREQESVTVAFVKNTLFFCDSSYLSLNLICRGDSYHSLLTIKKEKKRTKAIGYILVAIFTIW